MRLGAGTGRATDWEALVTEWRSLYKPAIAAVREKHRGWAGFDELHRETLDSLLPKYGLNTLSDAERDGLVLGWRELSPWPDVVAGLVTLREQGLLCAFSNGTTRQLADMARDGGLRWDLVFGADQFQTYKPAPETYQGAIRLLGAPPPGAVMLVAAHNEDLQAAASHGLQTAFVYRPTEDPEPTATYTYTAHSFEDLAQQLASA